jgi:hypothetical protein
MSAPAPTTVCDRGWTICFGPRELGADFRLTPRASFAMFCSPLPSLAAGETSNPTRWSLDGCQPRWAALQPPTIFNKAALPRRGSPLARTRWRDRLAATSIINALARQTRLRATSRLKRSYLPSAIGSPACFLIDPRPSLSDTIGASRADRQAQKASAVTQGTCANLIDLPPISTPCGGGT